jgi:hypothetical protein
MDHSAFPFRSVDESWLEGPVAVSFVQHAGDSGAGFVTE